MLHVKEEMMDHVEMWSRRRGKDAWQGSLEGLGGGGGGEKFNQ